MNTERISVLCARRAEQFQKYRIQFSDASDWRTIINSVALHNFAIQQRWFDNFGNNLRWLLAQQWNLWHRRVFKYCKQFFFEFEKLIVTRATKLRDSQLSLCLFSRADQKNVWHWNPIRLLLSANQFLQFRCYWENQKTTEACLTMVRPFTDDVMENWVINIQHWTSFPFFHNRQHQHHKGSLESGENTLSSLSL